MFNKDDVRIPYIMKKSVRKGVDLNPLVRYQQMSGLRIIIRHQKNMGGIQHKNLLSY